MISSRKVCAAPLAAAILATIAGHAALACAPTPQDAAEQFLQARARCDFIAAWRMLSDTERDGLGSVVAWSQNMALNAAEEIGCRSTVEGVEVVQQPVATDRRATVRFILAEPAVVLQFRLLRDEREFAPVSEWNRLDRLISDSRARLLTRDNWEPRMRHAAQTTVVREGEGHAAGWCVVDGYADRAALARANLERLQATNAQAAEERRQGEEQRRLTEVRDAESRRRGAAVLPQITAAAVRVGETALREPGVWAEIVNGSRETLREVEVRIEYLDAVGNVVGQRSFAPILKQLPVEISRRSEHAPLPPGQRRPFGVRADDAPSNWARRVRVVVVRVEADPNVEPAASPVVQQRPASPRPVSGSGGASR